MPRRGSSNAILERILDLVWSLWTELGVAGTRKRHSDWGIDPEPLIVFTSTLRDLDRRLVDEALDWCITYGQYISRVRLKNLVEAQANTLESFSTFSATVNEHANWRWPHSGRPFRYKPSGKSQVDDFTPQALLALRLRALFGVSARTEVIRSFLHAHHSLSAAELADLINYKKRNVSEALESLRLGGLLYSQQVGNQIRYRLNRDEIQEPLTPLPNLFPLWSPIFLALDGLLDVDTREESLAPRARAVAARSAADRIGPLLDQAGIKKPDAKVKGEAYWDVFNEWALEITSGLAFAEPERVFRQGQIPYFA